MGAMLRITRTDHTGAQLRALSVKCSNSAQVRRILAVAMVLDGCPRDKAASLNGMGRQTLCDESIRKCGVPATARCNQA